MFPMRDHLYELSKAHELELLKIARHDEMLQQAQNHSYEVWSLEPMRQVWRKLFGRMQRPQDDQGRTGQGAAGPLTGANVFEG